MAPSARAAGALTLTDDMGRQVSLPAPAAGSAAPQRIVSLAPSATEILFALGLGPEVVGVDEYSNYPAAASKLPKVGGFSTPSIEKIAALKPTLVLGTNLHAKFLPQFDQLHIPVLLLNPPDVSGILHDIQIVGRATGTTAAANQVVADIRSRLKRVQQKVEKIPASQRPWVYYEVWSDPLMTAGPNSFISQLITLAGGRNIAFDAKGDYPVISPENIIERNPDVILFPLVHGSDALTVEKLKARPGWEKISAVKAGRVFGIDADLISRPGPRVALAVEELSRLILPETGASQ
ncbi:MAG: cobalamin-binding protein [Firmicutes bacterium]|nr:cobalamin-binding protein [Bacillota bacterium]